MPADREIKPAPGQPGYYIVSAGFLKDIYDQQRILESSLEQCKLTCGGKP